MKMSLALASSLVGMLVVAGCGGDDPAGPGGTGAGAGGPGSGAGASGATSGPGGPGASTGVGTGGGNTGDWVELITADWELESGSEKTKDNHTLTLDHDIYVGAIRPIAPVGTHHTVLAVSDLDAGSVIYASGVGTNEIIFPKGVGLKLSSGQTLILQLHLFNVAANKITGTSGIEIIEVPAGDVETEADLFLPGPMDFSIPPNQTYSHSGTCTIGATQQIFAVFPHMHQLGSHLKTTLTIGGKEQILHDGDYSFNNQAFIPFAPIAMNQGDTVDTECTWKNTTPDSIGWGESSTAEMCFSILYRYPAQKQGGFGICTN